MQLVHKMRSGMSAEEAVDDIVTRSVSELRKNAFGDDIEDAKSLLWTREQAWSLMKQLSRQSEVSAGRASMANNTLMQAAVRRFHIMKFSSSSPSKEMRRPCAIWNTRN